MKKEISEDKVDFIVRNVVANSAFEGLVTPPEEIEKLKEIVRGNVSYEEYRRQLLEECRAYADVNR